MTQDQNNLSSIYVITINFMLGFHLIQLPGTLTFRHLQRFGISFRSLYNPVIYIAFNTYLLRKE